MTGGRSPRRPNGLPRSSVVDGTHQCSSYGHDRPHQINQCGPQSQHQCAAHGCHNRNRQAANCGLKSGEDSDWSCAGNSSLISLAFCGSKLDGGGRVHVFFFPFFFFGQFLYSLSHPKKKKTLQFKIAVSKSTCHAFCSAVALSHTGQVPKVPCQSCRWTKMGNAVQAHSTRQSQAARFLVAFLAHKLSSLIRPRRTWHLALPWWCGWPTLLESPGRADR